MQHATIQDQASNVLMPLVAGFVGHRTVAIGLRQGLLEALARAPDGMTTAELASHLELDAFYTEVWCRSALASRVLEVDEDGSHRLAEHVDTLLLDEVSPAHAGAMFTLMEQPEMFDQFEVALSTGDRTWWDEASDDFIADVSGTGLPFYTRLVPDGLEEVPGLAERLSDGDCRILDTACGAGLGVARLARTYPEATVVGTDGDARSLDLARQHAREEGVDDRVEFIHSPLEEIDIDEEFCLVTNNISMHECRDADVAAARIHAALEPDGWFVISDLPFPDSTAELRTLPGRVMAGVQFWEAQIDDQLVPREVYDDLLDRHGFTAIGSFELTPTHAVTHARAAQ